MNVIKQGTSRQGDTVLLQELLRKAGYTIVVDGDFGRGTDKIVKDFQARNNLVADGVVGAKTWIMFAIKFPNYYKKLASKFLSEADLNDLAQELGVDVAAVKAVRVVEAGGTGFWGERPKILFERHVFWRRLKQSDVEPRHHSGGNEDILARLTGGYSGGIKEYERINRAKLIHSDAALESASWGLFQIMGYHWDSLGYPDVNKFVELMHTSEGEQLKAFGRFLKVNNLVGHLKNHDWAKFAKGYNGPAYKKNHYDKKLAKAYAKASTDVA
jgi:hypothetical protein